MSRVSQNLEIPSREGKALFFHNRNPNFAIIIFIGVIFHAVWKQLKFRSPRMFVLR